MGGNINSDVGGIFSTTNSGTNWNLDINTSAEMFSYDFKTISQDSMDIWCVGSTGGSTGFTGKLYEAKTMNVVGIKTSGLRIRTSFQLYQNYPNPFNPSTIISYQLPISSNVNLTVFDILGNKMNVLVNEKQNPGTYTLKFDGSKFPSGIYFYKLTVGNYSETKKMLMIK